MCAPWPRLWPECLLPCCSARCAAGNRTCARSGRRARPTARWTTPARPRCQGAVSPYMPLARRRRAAPGGCAPLRVRGGCSGLRARFAACRWRRPATRRRPPRDAGGPPGLWSRRWRSVARRTVRTPPGAFLNRSGPGAVGRLIRGGARQRVQALAQAGRRLEPAPAVERNGYPDCAGAATKTRWSARAGAHRFRLGHGAARRHLKEAQVKTAVPLALAAPVLLSSSAVNQEWDRLFVCRAVSSNAWFTSLPRQLHCATLLHVIHTLSVGSQPHTQDAKAVKASQGHRAIKSSAD